MPFAPMLVPGRLLLLVLGLAVASAPLSAATEVRAGAAISLSGGNGLLAVDVDSVTSISAVRIDPVGRMFGGTTLSGLTGGTNIRLISLPPGEYRWSRVDLTGALRHLRVRDDARFRFRVEAGSINYAGDLCITPASSRAERFVISMTNRAARMLVHLDRSWPGARRQFPLRFQGAFPDRFLQFAATELGDQLATDALAAGSAGALNVATDAAPDLRALVGELFAPRQVRIVRLSPGGDLVAMVEYRDGKHRVSLIDAQSQVAADVWQGAIDVKKVRFADEHTLLVELDRPGGEGNIVVHVESRSGAAPAFSQYAIPGRGWFLDPPLADGTALYAHIGSDNALHIFRIGLGREGFDASQFRGDVRLDKGLDKAFYGLADGRGVLRFALTAVDGDYAAMYRPDAAGPWRQVQRYAADEAFQPILLDDDGASVIALTNKGRTQKDLVRIALPGGDVTQTLYSIAGTDIDGVLTRNRDRRVLGVLAYRDGSLETHYLDEPDDALRAAVARALPGKSIAIYDTDERGERMLVLASDEIDAGAFYLFDATGGSVRELMPIEPPMPHLRAVRSSVLKVVVADGTAIESYLTLPPERAPPYPLVVMPHGGPIGIRDNLHFDPEVQLLANRGYAVLRVNYRGSGGFGRAFEQAGFGAWGRSIEDDVLAALDAALSGAPIDRARVALRGASYGGYSTLMGLIRTPERFRCGVALSAVTDVPLLFTSSDWAQDERSRVHMMQIVGNPATALSDMEAVSPDYLYRKLDRPLLVIHGGRDARVPLEHALRLLLLLGHAGKPPQSLFFAHEAHGIEDPEARLQAETAIEQFLGACLAPADVAADR